MVQALKSRSWSIVSCSVLLNRTCSVSSHKSRSYLKLIMRMLGQVSQVSVMVFRLRVSVLTISLVLGAG